MPAGHRPDTASLSTKIIELEDEIAKLEIVANGHRADFERERDRADRSCGNPEDNPRSHSRQANCCTPRWHACGPAVTTVVATAGRLNAPRRACEKAEGEVPCKSVKSAASFIPILREFDLLGIPKSPAKCFKVANGGSFAMGRGIVVRTDYTSGDVRRIAQRVKNAAQARRLLAIAAVLDGSSREQAAKIGGMDRQTLRDWVIRFNEQGPDGLVNKSSPGAPGKLTDKHKELLARLVEEGPIPAVDGVVRWRACDLIMRLHEEFGISVSDDTVYRALKDLSFSHVSARPKAYKQDADAMEAFKKTFPPAWRKSARSLRPALR